MSFLLGDDYASSSSDSESDEEEAMPSRTDNKGLEEQGESAVQLLPSADSVLSSVSASTASFLPPKSSANAQTTIKSFNLIEEQKTRLQHEEKEDQAQKEAERVAGSRRIERKRPMPAGVTARPEAAKREKKDAKERVKNQRVKGQAGIGPDFRGWKSETEMALRQQFD